MFKNLTFILTFLVLSCVWASNASALNLELSQDHRLLTGMHPDNSTWTRRVANTDLKNNGEPKGPFTTQFIQHQEHVYVCRGRNLLKLEPKQGHVVWRDTLRSPCTKFSVVQGALHVTMKPQNTSKLKTPDMVVEAETHGLKQPAMMFTNNHGLAMLASQKLAQNLVEELVQQGALAQRLSGPLTGEPEELVLNDQERAQVEEALKTLEQHALADPTNLGYLAYIAKAHKLRRDQVAYQSTIERAFGAQARYHADLLGFAAMLTPFEDGDPTFDRAFELALAQGLRQGYEPHANHSLVSMIMFLRAPSILEGAQKWQKRQSEKSDLYIRSTSSHLERIWRFAPYVEMSAPAYMALARAYQDRGEEKKQQLWRHRAEMSERAGGYGMMVPNSVVERMGLLAYILWACGVALMMLLCLKVIRSLSQAWPEGGSMLVRYNLLNRLTRAELIGLLLIPVLAYLAYSVSQRDLLITQQATLMPIAWEDGCYDCAEVKVILDNMETTPEVIFVRAYTLQKSGDFQGASALYDKIAKHDARAAHNQALMCTQNEPLTCLKSNLTPLLTDPQVGNFAKYNLTKQGDTARFKDQRSLAPDVPLLVAPTRHDKYLLLDAQVKLSPMTSISSDSGHMNLPGSKFITTAWSVSLHIMILLLMLHALFLRPETTMSQEPRRWKTLARWVCDVIPGGSVHWGVLSGALCTAWLTSLMSWSVKSSAAEGSTSNIMINLLIPSFSKYYGIEMSMQPSHFGVAWWVLYHAWWIVLVANLFYVLAMRRLKPDM